jgi:hypothetical protein
LREADRKTGGNRQQDYNATIVPDDPQNPNKKASGTKA